MEESLRNITMAVQRLEEAIVMEKQKNSQNKEKIQQLQNVIKTSYERINNAIETAKKQSVNQSEQGEEICLSLS